jgi:capsular polysaccharide biosynthesis protein
MSHTSGPEDLQLIDYAGVLRRRWWLIVVVAALGMLAGIGYLETAPKVYNATASVYVTATSGTANQVANGRTTGVVNLDTQAQVVRSTAVAQAAAKLMHSPEAISPLLSRVSVAVPANSQVLVISCQEPTAAAAASCAQSFAQAYLSYTSATNTASGNSQISALQARIASLERASAKLIIEAASLPTNSSQRAAAEEQLTSDHSQLSSLNNQVAQLTATLANPSGGSVISSAIPPTEAVSPKPMLIVPSGLLAGLVIGLVLAYFTDRRRRQIRRPQDVIRADVPVLMSLPAGKPGPELAIAAPRSPLGREFSELAHMVIGAMGRGRHVILVPGVSRGQGASLVAANLAVALSRSQPDVTLICADLEGSVIPEMTGLPSGPGLTEVLADDIRVGDTEQRPAVAPQLRVIPPGSSAGPHAEDIRQDALERLLDEFGAESRWVVLEGPAVSARPDINTLAHVADAAILVAEIPRTRTDQLIDGAQHLGKMGADVLGAALLPAPRESGLAPPMPVLPDRRAALDGNVWLPEYAAISTPEVAAEPVKEDPEKTVVIDFPPAEAEEASSSLPRS